MRAKIDGGNSLYHYLQKGLQESDVWLFMSLVSRLVTSLGIWFSPESYARFPLLCPFAVRDPEARGNRAKGTPDQWGSPNPDGYFRDDNSLLKKAPGSLVIQSSGVDFYNNRRIGNGFTCSHVWREIGPERGEPELASRNPSTYSFVPNLVWLPSQVAKLTDREGSFAQHYIQALSFHIYRGRRVAPGLEPFVDRAWRLLPRPGDIPMAGLPDIAELNFFEFSDAFLRRRVQGLTAVSDALQERVEGGQVSATKVVSRRYTSGLKAAEPERLGILSKDMLEYVSAVSAAVDWMP